VIERRPLSVRLPPGVRPMSTMPPFARSACPRSEPPLMTEWRVSDLRLSFGSSTAADLGRPFEEATPLRRLPYRRP